MNMATFFSGSGETNLNFLIKGPDGWGAKTSAYIEGDFGGVWVGATYGTFSLRHAWMKLDWGKTKLTIGQQWQAFGLVPTYGGNLLGFSTLTPFMKGARQPQIVLNSQLDKNWSYMIGLMAPTSSLGGAVLEDRVNANTRAGMPYAEGEITWSSDACGKIGPWQMLFGLGGYYGSVKDSLKYADVNGISRYTDDQSPSWAAIFKGYIPIIPEKKGNKTGALSLSGAVMMGQNWTWMNPGPTNPTMGNINYTTGTSDNFRSASPVTWATWGQLTYFFSDKLFVNGYYGYYSESMSNTYRALPLGVGTGIRNLQHIAANIMYDINPAMRIGFEYANIYSRYASINSAAVNATAYDTKNSVNSFRIGAYYFF